MERLGQVQSGAVSKSFSRLGLCFVLALTALAIGAIVWHWDSIVASQGTLLVHLRAGGVVGPLWCVLAQALQVVIFIIPGEATQIAAGYVFGAWKGFLYAALGRFRIIHTRQKEGGQAMSRSFRVVKEIWNVHSSCFIEPDTLIVLLHDLAARVGTASDEHEYGDNKAVWLEDAIKVLYYMEADERFNATSFKDSMEEQG
jgi:hypothetical protein